MECMSEAGDALGAKACLARKLDDLEQDILSAERELETAIEGLETPERQRTARGRLGTSQAAWRAHRDLDCQLTAALAPAELDGGVLQVACAITQSQARLDRLLRLAEAIVPLEIPTETLDAFDVSERRDGEQRIYFRDWLAACRPEGDCAAAAYVFAEPGSNAAAAILRVYRDTPDDAWSLVFAGLANAPDPNNPLSLRIGDTDPITLEPRSGFRPVGAANVLRLVDPAQTRAVLDAMKAGLEVRVRFSDPNGDSREERFSLRGLTAALEWIDDTQPGMSEAAAE